MDDYFDEAYLESFEINVKLKDDIDIQVKNLRNPNFQKQFKSYYYDKDKIKAHGRFPSTSGSL